MSGMPSVQIILGTYNGSQWLDATLTSILSQDSSDWELIVRDDGSTDETIALLQRWSARLGKQMTFLQNSSNENLGAKYNVLRLLAATTSPYVIFAGQDDIWLKDKVRRTISEFIIAETMGPAEIPIVICSDAEVVNAQALHVAPSYFAWARINPLRTTKMSNIAMESPCLGATMAVNRAMIKFALPIPEGFHDADFWLGLIAATFGKLVVLNEPTIRYRRHGTNASQDPFGGSVSNMIKRLIADPMAPRRRLHQVLLEQSAPQAAAFYALYHDRLSQKDAAALDALGRLSTRGPIARRLAILRHGLWYGSPLKNLGMLILL